MLLYFILNVAFVTVLIALSTTISCIKEKEMKKHKSILIHDLRIEIILFWLLYLIYIFSLYFHN